MKRQAGDLVVLLARHRVHDRLTGQAGDKESCGIQYPRGLQLGLLAEPPVDGRQGVIVAQAPGRQRCGLFKFVTFCLGAVVEPIENRWRQWSQCVIDKDGGRAESADRDALNADLPAGGERGPHRAMHRCNPAASVVLGSAASWCQLNADWVVFYGVPEETTSGIYDAGAHAALPDVYADEDAGHRRPSRPVWSMIGLLDAWSKSALSIECPDGQIPMQTASVGTSEEGGQGLVSKWTP